MRLALSLSGTPNESAKWISVTSVLLLGVVFYGVAVHTSGFGSYKQLYPLLLFQSLLGEGLVALAIVLAIFTGRDNIYTAPEYSGGGDGKNWTHVIAHLVVAAVILPLLSWAHRLGGDVRDEEGGSSIPVSVTRGEGGPVPPDGGDGRRGRGRPPGEPCPR